MSHSDYDVPVKEITDEEFADIRSRLVRPFSSDGSLLFRAEIYVTPTKVHLHLDFSHMIMDGDSYEIILKDIDRAYNGNTLEAETFTFYEMINEQHDFLESSGRERTIQYYRQLFSESPAPTSFHKDKHESAPASTRYDRRISVGIKEIQKMCSQLKISDMVFFMGLLSAYVAKDGGKNAAYFPVAYNGRNNSRAQNTVGFLTQMFFALSMWEKETTVGEYLQSLQKQILLPMSFTCQPYLEMLADFPELFTYGFSFLGEVPEYYPLGNASLKAEALSDEGGGGLYGIYQEIMIRDGYYYCSTEYRTNEYEEDSIRKMVEALDIMLERFDPGMKLNELLKTEAG